MAPEEREELLPAGTPGEIDQLSVRAKLPGADNNEDTRPSSDIGDDDDVIEEEEERGRLIERHHGREGIHGLQRLPSSSKQAGGQKASKRERRRLARSVRRTLKRGGRQQEPEIMYEMEEGDRWAGSDSSRSSSEADRERLGNLRQRKSSRKSRVFRFTIIHVVIVLTFLALLFAAYKASHRRPAIDLAELTLSNGTSNFAATTILISLDGFRADFLQRGLTPTLNAFIQDGISPQYMLPSFPSVTFPNHFTLVTGLYPESHGVVGNTFWDPDLEAEFYYTDPTRSMQPKWWDGEPLWVTAEDQGVRSAIHMWPGSEAHIGDIEPSYVDKYNGTEVLSRKVERVLSLLDLPGPDSAAATTNSPRPQLIAAYVPNVDADGHRYGPNSTEIRATIQDVDQMLNDLFEGLEQRNLTNIVNVIVVSDHGMATTSNHRLLQLEDLIDTDLVEHIDGWPLYGLRPKDEMNLRPLYNELKEKAQKIDSIEVYLRDEDMPKRYHFSNNHRIAPLWIVPKTGWAIVTKDEFDLKKSLETGEVYHPRGLHGYDHEHPLMRAIFVARGPAFPHKPGSRVEVFQNTEVYNLVCDSLGVSPVPNNGTLRLPLKPIGLHSDEGVIPPKVPNDPPADGQSISESLHSTTFSMPAGATTSISIDPPATGVHETNEDDKSDSDGWASWASGKLDSLKNWAWSLFHKVKPVNTDHVLS
ncbi:MAG: hypothetical protein Q9157_008156 [Trypethelium eluteriae]